MTIAAERLVSEVSAGEACFRCALADGTGAEVPAFLGRFLRQHDRLAFLSAANTDVLGERWAQRGRPQQFLFATIGYVGQPKPSDGVGFFVRAELPNCCEKPNSLFLSACALSRHFYL